MYVASVARYINNAGSIVLRRLRKAMPVWTIALVLAFIGTVSYLPGTAAQAFAAVSNAQGVSIDAGGSGDGGSFVADEYYSDGLTASNTSGSNGEIAFPPTVAHPIPQADWNTYRYLENTYQIPDLSPGGVYHARRGVTACYYDEKAPPDHRSRPLDLTNLQARPPVPRLPIELRNRRSRKNRERPFLLHATPSLRRV